MDDEQLISRNRAEIDRIDGELLRLLNRRAECAREIGQVKRKNRLPIHVPDRERAVLTRLVGENLGPLPAESIREVFQTIFDQMKKLESQADLA
jgi:chorismate mutase/prephenate dehydratase